MKIVIDWLNDDGEVVDVTRIGDAGWIECGEPHEKNGRSASDGPFDCNLDAPWCDEEEYEFHGVLHTWRFGHGWTVPYNGCVVAGSNWEPPDGAELKPPGRYRIDDDWDDTEVYLQFTEATS